MNYLKESCCYTLIDHSENKRANAIVGVRFTQMLLLLFWRFSNNKQPIQFAASLLSAQENNKS